MEYRKLGSSGLTVSRLCLGTMMFGEHTDARTAGRIVGAARDAGVNFFDTADTYGDGASERILGRLLHTGRNRFVIATKFGNRLSDGNPNSGGLGRKWAMQAVEASLRRLGTDHVDIVYFHRDDPGTDIAEIVSVIDLLVRQGKARYVGLSNIAAWRMVEIVSQCRARNVPQPVVLQPPYNLLNRMPETELLPACGYYGLGVVPYSPLARGVLTGKYVPGRRPPAGSRGARGERRFLDTDFRVESLAIAQRLRQHAEKKGMTLAQFALAWVLGNSLVTSVLAGPRTLSQWRHYVSAGACRLDAEDEAVVDALVAPGHPSTPGYTDPKYPVLGRPRGY